MTKILSFGSFGGHIPALIAQKIDEIRTLNPDSTMMDVRTNPELIAFIETFAGNPLMPAFGVAARPNELFLTQTTTDGGLTSRKYAGVAKREDPVPVASVTVNEFDETTTRCTFTEYDGSEALIRIPEYVPVPGVPGLYEPKR